jgi:hypothetical protein
VLEGVAGRVHRTAVRRSGQGAAHLLRRQRACTHTLTVGRESYPLTRRLFLYTAATPRNPLVGKFVSFVQSDAGQKIVNKDGFVSTVTSLATSKSASRGLPATAPSRYREL